MSDGRCPNCYGYMTTGGCPNCDSQNVSNDNQPAQANPLDLLKSRADKSLLELQKAQYALRQISNAKTLEEAQYMACHALVQTCYLLPPVDSSLYESDFDFCVKDWLKANETKIGYTYPEFMGKYFPNDTDDNNPSLELDNKYFQWMIDIFNGHTDGNK